MKVEKLYKIELSYKEALVLHMLLGSIKDIDKLKIGLDKEDIKFLSELYNKLPFEREEENE